MKDCLADYRKATGGPPEEKVAILRRHLLEQVPISELCDKQGLQPTVFYRWHKEFFENGASAFEAEEAKQPLR